MVRKLSVPAMVRRIGSSDVALGATVVLVALATLTGVTVFYLNPPGRTTIAFETTDAASLDIGQDVRVAGISVGSVTKVSAQPTTVRVEAEVDADTFVGADSQVSVRMLTPVGGYAITLTPIGSKPLGDAVIPVDRVKVPYSIADVLQASPHVTEKVDGKVIDANIEQVADALEHNSTSVGSLINGMNSIAAVMDRQREQVHQVADLASEYLVAFNNDREFIFDFIRRVEIVASTYNYASAGFNESYHRLGDVLMRVTSVEKFYLGHKDEVLAAVNKLRDAISDAQTNLKPIIDQLLALKSQLEAWLTPEGMTAIGGGTIMASNVCIPVAGRTC
ncbi:MlaD family protein [Nocardia neocaledoniensis]|uniref:MlaD family protein n=1 Tax=Nocardia neocaledoniensis TaxID=236511 RepID=UPI002453D9F2|nr:MlaD family protein [Nocardia neocaledoniensis]